MNLFRSASRGRALATLVAGSIALTAAAALSGFHVNLHEITPPGSRQTSELTTAQVVGIRTWKPTSALSVTSDVTYGTADDGARLDLDVCAPPTPAAPGELRRGILSIHGGSWARGDKANTDWRDVCEWFASEGFVAFSVNYRLAPAARFPAGIDDVTEAAAFVRRHAEEYGIDPDRIGAFGGSAGGNLAALLAMKGTGALDTGSRVAALAELSGPVDLTTAGLAAASPLVHQIAQSYLGCTGPRGLPAGQRGLGDLVHRPERSSRLHRALRRGVHSARRVAGVRREARDRRRGQPVGGRARRQPLDRHPRRIGAHASGRLLPPDPPPGIARPLHVLQ